MNERLRRAWPHVRAILITLHLASVVVLSIPGSSIVANRRSWETRNARAEFTLWAGRLSRLGFETTPEEFETGLWTFASGFGRWRDRVSRPFRTYATMTGARQGWQMFATPQKHPAELHIDVEVDGKWRALVRPRDPRSTWRRSQLTHNRFRKLLGRFARTFHRDRYEGICRWLAAEAANDHPEVQRVRARLWRYRSLGPADVTAGRVPEGSYEHELVFEAREFR